MARGRMIANEITKDKDVNQLSSDLSRLAFTWLITFADVEGRTYGDPALVRSMLFPRRDDISIAQVEAFIHEWHDIGLVVWYEAQGDLWIFFPNFHKHQQLRRDKEAPSHIPAPPEVQPIPEPIDVPATPEGRSDDGAEAELALLKEVKLKEIEVNKKSIENDSIAAGAAPQRTPGQTLFLDAFGAKRFKTKVQAQAICDLEDKFGIDLLQQGVNWAATNGMDMGRAIASLKTALPKWGEPRGLKAHMRQDEASRAKYAEWEKVGE